MRLRMFLLLFFVLFAESSFGQGGEFDLPYSKPPVLSNSFVEDFESDARDGYAILGRKDSVHWNKGSLALLDGAVVQKKVDAGTWLEMEVDLAFPKLVMDGQKSELRIFVDLQLGSDCCLWFHQKRENGKVDGGIVVVDTNGQWNSASQPLRASVPCLLDRGLSNGTWRISYRGGLWIVEGPKKQFVLRGFSGNADSNLQQVIFHAARGETKINNLSYRKSRKVEFGIPKDSFSELQKILPKMKLVKELYRTGNAEKIKQAIAVSESIAETQKRIVGGFYLGYANQLCSQGTMQTSLANYKLAETLIKQSLSICERVRGRKHPDYAEMIGNLAVSYSMAGRNSEAVSKQIEANSILVAAKGKMTSEYAHGLTSLGGMYSLLGSFKKAEEVLQEALKIREKIHGKRNHKYAGILNNLAEVFRLLGKDLEAEELHLEALSIREHTLGNRHPEYAQSLNNLGIIYEKLGDIKKARSFFFEALEIRREIEGKQHPEYARSLYNLGNHFLETDEIEKALPLFQEALAIRKGRLGELHPDYAKSVGRLGVAHRILGDYSRAEEMLIDAATIHEKALGKEHPTYAQTLNSLATLYHFMEKSEKVRPLLTKALNIRKKTLGEDHVKYANSLSNLARCYVQSGDFKSAEPYFEESLSITRETVRRYSVLQNNQQRRELAHRFHGRFSEYVSNALKLENRGQRVWDHAIRWKGMSLLREKRNLILGAHPKSSSTFEKLREIRTRLSKHLFMNPASKGWNRKKEELQTASDNIEKELNRVAEALEIPNAMHSKLEWRLPAKSCVVDFRQFTHFGYQNEKRSRSGSRHFLALIKTPNEQVTMIDLGPARKIEAALRLWRSPIEAANASGRPIDSVSQQKMDAAGLELRNLIWKPLEGVVSRYQVVIVSPDGALGRLPLVALPGTKPGTYLLEETRIVNFPVPILLPQILNGSAKVINDKANALFAGAIDYGKSTEPELRKKSGSKSSHLLNNVNFSELKNTKVEVDRIAKRFSNAVLLSGATATEANFVRNLKGKSILHIASHGFFFNQENSVRSRNRLNSGEFMVEFEREKRWLENPDFLSGVAFANANSMRNGKVVDGSNDGIMHSFEISMIPMEHVELAVLSACETGLGAVGNPGEGLIGMQRAFQVAGAKSVLASYWKVDDRATQLLMNKFYENLLQYSENADEEMLESSQTTIRLDALRDAQLWMLNNSVVASMTSRGDILEIDPSKIRKAESMLKSSEKGKRTHPRYWAAFSLSGDWR